MPEANERSTEHFCCCKTPEPAHRFAGPLGHHPAHAAPASANSHRRRARAQGRIRVRCDGLLMPLLCVRSSCSSPTRRQPPFEKPCPMALSQGKEIGMPSLSVIRPFSA